MIKRIDSTASGMLIGFTGRQRYCLNSGNDTFLRMNTSGSKDTSNDYIDSLNAGFTITSSAPRLDERPMEAYVFLAIA